MKIISVGPYYPFRGGISTFNGLLCYHLRKKGYEVIPISFKRLYPGIFFPGKTQFEENISPARNVSIRIIDSLNPVSWYKAGKLIAIIKPDLVIFHHWHSFFAPIYSRISSFLKRKTDCKLLVICHNIFPHEPNFFDRLFLKRFFNKLDGFILLAGKLLEQLNSLVDDPLYRISPHPLYNHFPDALDRQIARNRLGIKEERVILYFGLVREYKGVDYLIKSVDKICTVFPVRFLIVGEFYIDKNNFLKILENVENKHLVTIVDRYVSDEEVSLYFSAADLIVLPYREATQSGVIKIAYHYDKPVVVTDVGGLREDVIDGKTGFVVPPMDVTKLSEAIIKFFNENYMNVFSNNIKRFKRKYSWNGLVSTILDLYSELR